MVPCPQCDGRGTVIPEAIDIGIFKPDRVILKFSCQLCRKVWEIPRALAPRVMPHLFCMMCGSAILYEQYERSDTNDSKDSSKDKKEAQQE
jgi:hypothetical protein